MAIGTLSLSDGECSRKTYSVLSFAPNLTRRLEVYTKVCEVSLVGLARIFYRIDMQGNCITIDGQENGAISAVNVDLDEVEGSGSLAMFGRRTLRSSTSFGRASSPL